MGVEKLHTESDEGGEYPSEKDGILSRYLPPWTGALLFVATLCVSLYFRYPGKFESFAGAGSAPPRDFAVFLQGYTRLMAGENPYVVDAVSSGFKLSPAFLALIGSLPRAPQDAWFFFTLISIASLAATLMSGARFRRWRDVFLLMAGVGLAWKGIIETLDSGQPELLLLALVTLATSLFTRFTILSGAVLGMLPWIKLPLLFMLIPFILAAARRHPESHGRPPVRRLKLFVSGFLLSSVFWGAGIPSLAFGPEKALWLSQQWVLLLKSQPHAFFGTDVNQSLWATIDRLLNDKLLLNVHYVAVGVSAMLGGWLLGLLTLRRPYAPTAQDAFVWQTPWLIAGQLLNPLSWRWGSVYLVGALFSAFRPGRQWQWMRGWVSILLPFLFLLQQSWFVRQVIGFSGWTEIHDLGSVTAYWLVLLILSV